MQEPNVSQQGLDVTRYTELKAAGRIALLKPIKASQNYVLHQRRFNPDTGAEATPATVNINRGDLLEKQAHVQAQIAAWQATLTQLAAIKADMDALDI